jgi:hypothetical protein
MPADGAQPADDKLLSSGGTVLESYRFYPSAPTETADTKPQSDHAPSRLRPGIVCA